MTITSRTLTRLAGLAAVAGGLVFMGVQINHPHTDITTIATTEMAVRNTLKLVMAALVLVGITGMYLRQTRQTGVLGLAGYLVFGATYLSIMSTTFVAAYVLPSLVDTDPDYVRDVLEASTNGAAEGDIGALGTILQIQGFTFLAGGLLFGLALYRARVLSRWASALLAVSGFVSVALALMPDAFYRLLAFPNAIAVTALGYSLWRVASITETTSTSRDAVDAPVPQVTTAGAA
jgi:hypothetical protein